VLWVPRAAFVAALVDPKFARAALLDLANRLWVSTHSLKAAVFQDVDARLARLIMDCAGAADTEGFRLTQGRMARDLGVSLRAVSKSISKFRRLGLLEKHGARYLIADPAGLRALRDAG
jgi:CRP-like cAMP-binding protein